MARTPEGRVKDAVVKILKEQGVYYFFPQGTTYGRNGIPDIIICCGGRFIAVECKAPGKHPTALQTAELNRIIDAGGIAMIVSNEVDLGYLSGVLKMFKDMQRHG